MNKRMNERIQSMNSFMNEWTNFFSFESNVILTENTQVPCFTT